MIYTVRAQIYSTVPISVFTDYNENYGARALQLF